MHLSISFMLIIARVCHLVNEGPEGNTGVIEGNPEFVVVDCDQVEHQGKHLSILNPYFGSDVVLI